MSPAARLRRQGRWWSAIAMVTCLAAVGCFAYAGLRNLYLMELERSVEPLWAAARGILGIAELAACVWFAVLARRMFRHWRHFRSGAPP